MYIHGSPQEQSQEYSAEGTTFDGGSFWRKRRYQNEIYLVKDVENELTPSLIMMNLMLNVSIALHFSKRSANSEIKLDLNKNILKVLL